MSKKKEQKDQLLTSETPLGLLDQIPGIAPFDYTTPTVTNTQITDDPLTQYEVNRVYNNQRYAVDFSTTYRAITLTPFKEIDDTSTSTGIINYIAGFFGLVTGYCHIRIPTLHDGVLPIPDVRLYGTREYDIVAAMYPKVYQFRTKDPVPPRSIIEVQTLDINRNNYNLLEILEKGKDIPVAVVSTGGSSTPKPVGSPPVPDGDAPEPLATGADPCADGGNFKAVRDKDIADLYHAMQDFIPDSVLPLKVPAKAGSPPCERIGPFSGVLEPHKGIDISAKTGTPLFNVARGRVVRLSSSGPKGGGNDIIVIWHYRDGEESKKHSEVSGKKLYTRHLHCDDRMVTKNQLVGAGQQIGTTGNKGSSKGPHLHYEIRWGTGPKLNDLGDVIAPFRVDGSKDISPQAAEYKKS